MTQTKKRVLLLGNKPHHLEREWAEFASTYDVVQDDSATRDDFLAALKSRKCVGRLCLAALCTPVLTRWQVRRL